MQLGYTTGSKTIFECYQGNRLRNTPWLTFHRDLEPIRNHQPQISKLKYTQNSVSIRKKCQKYAKTTEMIDAMTLKDS
jgi:hypothetical protein